MILVDGMLILKVVLLPLATWRFYRLVASDTGYKQFLRKIRIVVGVKYEKNKDGTVDYSHWSTKDGSFAEGLTCSKCAPIWWGTILSLLLLFAPDWVYLIITLPLNASALVLTFENIIYSPREFSQYSKDVTAEPKKEDQDNVLEKVERKADK